MPATTETPVKNLKRLYTNTRNSVGTSIYALGSYFDGVPLDKVNTILEDNGLVLIQEDGSIYSGFFCGREGRALLELAHKESAHDYKGYTKYIPIDNSCLVVEWCLVHTLYDVNMYLS